MAENLWPTDFGELAQKTPVAILREQAQALGERTANVVVGRVASGAEGPGKFRHILNLYSAPLGYLTELLWIEHGIDLYPVEIRLTGYSNEPLNDPVLAANPDEFNARLKEMFSREKTKKTIASLLAQSKE
jgi:hypothetical protein